MGRLEGKICLITGAAGAIGGAMTALFAREGATVVATDVVQPSGEVEGAADFMEHDVADAARWTEVVDAVVAKYGRLDVLVNNAGWEGTQENALDDVSIEDWRKVQAINVEGVFFGCREAMRVMKAQGGGNIVNLSSIAGLIGTPQQISYGVSKAAVKQLTLSVAQEGIAHKVRCNAIHPGMMDTKMLRNIFDNAARKAGTGSDNVATRFGDMIPMGHLGSARDVAYGALYLASDEASYVTAISLTIDGGVTGL